MKNMNCYFLDLVSSIYDFKQEDIQSWLCCNPYSEGGLGQVEAHCFFCLLSFSVERNVTEDIGDVMEELT